MKQLHRWKLYFDKDLEESWLNQLAQQGWGLTSFCLGRYTFEPIEPGEYIYRRRSAAQRRGEKAGILLSPARDGGGGHPAVGLLVFLPPPAQARAPSSCTATRPPKPATTAASPGCFFWLRCWKLSAPSFRYPPSSPETVRSTWLRWYCCFLLGAVLLRQGMRFQRKQKEQQK